MPKLEGVVVARSTVAGSTSRVLTPIIKVVGDHCNLRCAYCFYNTEDQSVRHVMDDGVLEQFIREYLELFAGRLSFIWHGGEPLMAGIRFFERVIALQKKYSQPGTEIRNHIQTNGTLLNARWASFIKRHDFHIGLSLDGGEASHNHFRRDAAGGGTFERVQRGINVLRSHDIHFGVIQVLTADTVSNLPADFRFFSTELGLKHWSLNIFNASSSSPLSAQTVSNAQCLTALKTITSLWMDQADPGLTIREVEALVQGACGKRSAYCSFSGDCDRYFCVNWDGSVFPCDSYTGEPDKALGNISDAGLSAVLCGEARRAWLEKVTAVHSDCKECRWQPVCHNGCPQHRDGGPQGKYVYCEARREMFTHMEDLISEKPTAT